MGKEFIFVVLCCRYLMEDFSSNSPLYFEHVFLNEKHTTLCIKEGVDWMETSRTVQITLVIKVSVIFVKLLGYLS